MMELSIVIPVYNEEKSVAILYRQLKEVLRRVNKNYEIIFVDDGSKDNTVQVLRSIKDNRLRVIEFQKNFGKSAALSAGFDHANGNIVITMDGDLEDDPREIPNFLKAIQSYDLVVGWRYKRKHTITKKIPSFFFNFLIRLLTRVKIHDSNCGFKAFRKKVVKNIDLYGELHRYIPLLALWNGFKVGEIKIIHHKRKFGKSKWGSSRLLKGFLDLITVKFLTEYSSRPSHLFGTFGILLTLFGLGIIAFLYIRKFLFGIYISTAPFLFALGILFAILGVQFISIGLLGEMVTSSSKRKRYIIK